MNRKIFAILITLLFLLSILSVSITACCLPINLVGATKETLPVTKTIQATETKVIETIPETTPPETIKKSYFDNIDNIIRFNVEEYMFPPNWYNASINAKAESSKPEDIELTRVLAIEALGKYPDEFLFKYLDKAYFLSYLCFYDIEYGGTNSLLLKTIFVNNIGINQGTEYRIEQTIHAELSSIPYNGDWRLFPLAEWGKINPQGFEYTDKTGTGAEAMKDNASLSFDPLLNEQGFLYEYAMSTLENDYNSVIGNLFLNDGTFWEIYEKYPKIKQKTDLAIDFYIKLNPIFTMEYFKQISKE